MPHVTVVIPTYNYAEVLPYSIGSVLRQTYRDFELLVVGDHCTDRSQQVVEAVDDPRVRWINLEKGAGHQSGPNNYALEHGVGELVAYLGHDDLWLPWHLERLTREIASGADLAYGLTEMVYPDNAKPTYAPQEMNYTPGMWMPPSSVVHRREMGRKVGGWRHYRETQLEPESDLWLRLHQGGGKLCLVPMLTAIKFPAALRKGVYKTRPTDEQALWSRRMQEEPDFAATELVRMLVQNHYRKTISQLTYEYLREVYHRCNNRLKGPGTALPMPTRDEIYEERLKFKEVSR